MRLPDQTDSTPSGSTDGTGGGVGSDTGDRRTRADILASVTEFADRARLAVTIVDPHVDDAPVIHANQAFIDLTGYSIDECLGRNCRYMQGPETDRVEARRVGDAMRAGENCVVELLNYRKDGSTFWNALHISPILDDAGEIVFYYGSQWNVSGRVAHRSASQVRKALSREMHHRLRNLLAVASSIVRLSAHGDRSAMPLVTKASDRIQALGRAHEATFSPSGDDYEMADLRSVIQAMVKSADADKQSRLTWEGPDMQLPIAAITPLGLTLHELIVNAHEHGALACDGGTVDVAWHREGERLHLVWSEHGVRDKGGEAGAVEGFGTRTISNILRSVGGTSDRSWTDDGIRVELTVNCAAA